MGKDKANSDKVKKNQKEYRTANSDKLKEYRAANKDKAKEYQKNYYAANNHHGKKQINEQLCETCNTELTEQEKDYNEDICDTCLEEMNFDWK